MKNNYKKLLVCALVFVMVLAMLTACGSSAKTEEPAAGMVNPVSEVSAEELTERTGFVVEAPDGAENVSYAVIDAGEEKIAQMSFVLNGTEYNYRLSRSSVLEAVDNSGVYGDAGEESAEVLYCNAVLRKGADFSVIYWLDIVPGVNYTLSSNGSAEELVSVANLIFAPTQGDAEGDADVSDISGRYEDGNYNSVELTADGAVTISIYRLTTFEGTGSVQDGVLSFEVGDPAEEAICGVFSPAGDGSYTLTFTKSGWSLLESGTEFTGFVLK